MRELEAEIGAFKRRKRSLPRSTVFTFTRGLVFLLLGTRALDGLGAGIEIGSVLGRDFLWRASGGCGS